MPHERDPERPDPAEPSRDRIRETLIERKIRAAMEGGAFDDLPHRGSRLPLEDDSAAGERAMAHRILRNAGVAPGWIEADKTVRALIDERDRLLSRAPRLSALGRALLDERDLLLARAPRLSSIGRARARDEMTRLVEATNRAIVRVNIAAPTDRQHRRPLDLEVELARLDHAARGEPLVIG